MAAAKGLGLGGNTQNGFTFWDLNKPPRRPNDPLVALDHAWERYHGNAEALVKDGVTDENRSMVVAVLRGRRSPTNSIGGSRISRRSSPSSGRGARLRTNRTFGPARDEACAERT